MKLLLSSAFEFWGLSILVEKWRRDTGILAGYDIIRDSSGQIMSRNKKTRRYLFFERFRVEVGNVG